MSTKPCRICNISRDDAENQQIAFKSRQNLCIPCYKSSQQQYRAANRERLKRYNKSYRESNLEELRAKDRGRYKKGKRKNIQDSPERFIRSIISRTKARCTKPSSRRKKIIEFSINSDYAIKLYSEQNGLCAITKLKMTYQFNCHKQISIDRIDSTKGYIKGNVQFLCRWVNYAKNDMTNEQLRKLLVESFDKM